VEVLKRVDQMTPDEIPDAAFIEAGEMLFRQLDAEEAGDAESRIRFGVKSGL